MGMGLAGLAIAVVFRREVEFNDGMIYSPLRMISKVARRKIWRALAMVAVASAFPVCGGDIDTVRVASPAAKAFEEGQGAWGVKLNDSGAVVLYDRTLIEDDGPGIRSDADWLKTDRAPTTEITGNTRVKKTLYVERPEAWAAHLVAPSGVGIELNGKTLVTSNGFTAMEIPPSVLKQGNNDVVLYSLDGKAQTIKFARVEDILRNAPERKDWPRRSFKSIDGGATWEAIDGEYTVRLHLEQYAPQGTFISPVIDLGGSSADGCALLTPVTVQSVKLTPDADVPDGSRVELAFRAGSSPVYDASTWSGWQTLESAIPSGARYLQWKATLSSDDPLKTPALRSVAVEAKVARQAAPAWAGGLKVDAVQNEEIRYTSMPFEYEDPMNPRMVALRQKYKLDEVVSGAATETEQLVRLRDWVAHQWAFKPPEENYPPWDADRIISGRYGFCVQFAISMMQCAISLGHQARFVFGYNPGAFDGGGHEVCEIWSNEHSKWMFFDVNQDWDYVDARTLVPKSMLEVHDLIMKAYYGDRLATLDSPPSHREPLDDLALCWGTNMTPSAPPKNWEIPYVDGHCTVPTRWLFFNYVPRNNFLAKPYPQPLTQGAHWDWTDYWCWEDALTPKRWLYRNFTARRSDVSWTLNQVHFDATLQDRPGAVAIQMGTFTPYFDTFLVRQDGQDWKESARTFTWDLQPGHNRLEMRTRTQAKVQGPLSYLEVEYRP